MEQNNTLSTQLHLTMDQKDPERQRRHTILDMPIINPHPYLPVLDHAALCKDISVEFMVVVPKKNSPDLKKIVFTYKGMDHESDMGYNIRSLNHNAELQETR